MPRAWYLDTKLGASLPARACVHLWLVGSRCSQPIFYFSFLTDYFFRTAKMGLSSTAVPQGLPRTSNPQDTVRWLRGMLDMLRAQSPRIQALLALPGAAEVGV